MHVILVPFGSHGDVHPLMGLGRELRSRGHRVTFLQPEYFAPLIREAGFDVETFGGLGRYEEAMRNPDLWSPRKAFPLVAGWAMVGAREVYDAIARLNVPGETVVVGGTLAFGALLANEKLGVPTASVHLQPTIFHSDVEPSIQGGIDSRRWPFWFRKWFYNLVFTKMVDPYIEPRLNALRAELGLAPIRNTMRGWIHSAGLVMGFFPNWFAPPQVDWPSGVKLIGFPLYDEHDVTPLSAELRQFLDEGTPPIAFTPGSANIFGRPFFEAAIDACVRLGRRGILLTRFAEQVPENLPQGVKHFAYAPFSQLLPHTAALVHHGGIGTASQGLAAGVPQLVMPLAHDQFDNVARMARLGVARSLVPKKFRGPAVARTLRGWIDSPDVLAACLAVKQRIAAESGSLARAAEAVEALAERTGVQVS